MQSTHSIEKTVRDNQNAFLLLEELDRTGKLKKLHYKKQALFTIDEDVLRTFRFYCQQKGYKMSVLVEKLIKEYLRTEGKK